MAEQRTITIYCEGDEYATIIREVESQIHGDADGISDLGGKYIVSIIRERDAFAGCVERLRSRVAELESRQADDGQSSSKEKMQKALEQSHTGLGMILPDSLAVVPDDRAYFRQLVIELIRANRSNVMWEANGIFDEVLRREKKVGAS